MRQLLPSTQVSDAQFMIFVSGLSISSGSTYNTKLDPTNLAAIGCVSFVAASGAGTTTLL